MSLTAAFFYVIKNLQYPDNAVPPAGLIVFSEGVHMQNKITDIIDPMRRDEIYSHAYRSYHDHGMGFLLPH